MQETLSDLGLVPAVIRLIVSCANDPDSATVVHESLLLCVALLTGGNLKVQKRFFKEFRAAKDGGLLRVLADRIHKATDDRRTAAKEVRVSGLLFTCRYTEFCVMCRRGRMQRSFPLCLPNSR